MIREVRRHVNQNVDHDNPIECRTIPGREARIRVTQWQWINGFVRRTDSDAPIKVSLRMCKNLSKSLSGCEETDRTIKMTLRLCEKRSKSYSEVAAMKENGLSSSNLISCTISLCHGKSIFNRGKRNGRFLGEKAHPILRKRPKCL
jgi:hypothetical protein